MSRPRVQFTSAHLMAGAALFISLGGTSYAVTQLPKNSVGSPQVKDGSLSAKDLQKGVLTSGPAGAAGARGPRGADGPAGPAGPTGPAGPNVPLVSSLPTSPPDGQTVHFQSAAMASAGVIWQLRYRAAAPGPYKWEFVGGSGLHAGGGYISSSSTTYLGGTAGPALTLPLAGEYEADISGRLYQLGNTAGSAVYLGLGDSTGEIPNAHLDQYQGSAGAGITLVAADNARVTRFTRGAPGAVELRLYGSGGQVVSDWRDLRIVPVRVG